METFVTAMEHNVNINVIKVAVVTTGFHHKGFNKLWWSKNLSL